jgi:hypothetical protein
MGGAGSDTFVFGLTPAANGVQGFGSDLIFDFTPGQDHLQFNDGLFACANAALAAAKDDGFGGIDIELDPLNHVHLSGLHLADLHASDFIIVPPSMAGAAVSGGNTSGQADSSLAQLVQAMASHSAGSAMSDPMSSTQMPGDPNLQNAIGMSHMVA